MSVPSVRPGRVFALCFAAGLCEGYDMMVAGVAAPRFSPLFGLGPQQMGWVFGAAGIGLLIGAIVGGRLADLVGRRSVLVGALLVLGIFSLASAEARNLPWLLVLRFLTGLGLGGALPNLLALVNETSPSERAATRVTMLGSAMPFGGACLGLLTVVMPDLGWQTLFRIGGIAPIVVAICCHSLLPSFRVHSAGRAAAGIPVALAGEGRGAATLLLWASTLCLSMSISMLVNWLPSLMIAREFGPAPTGRIVMLLTLGGAASGFAFGLLARRFAPQLVHRAAWIGMIASVLLMLAAAGCEAAAGAAAFGLGFFLSGGQFLLYGLTTALYPRLVRGTGTGFAVGVGRLGAVLGPLLAGAVLAGSGDPDHALLSLLPLLGLSMVTDWRLSVARSEALERRDSGRSLQRI